MKYFKKHPIQLSLLIITVLYTVSFGLLIPFLGFYSEDFFFSYIGHYYGVPGLLENNAIDRPFDGYLFAFFYSILGYGNNILVWHISMFILRLISGLLVFYLLNLIFKKQLYLVTLITLLFTIYPGFLEQSLPLGYQIYPIALIFYISSLIFNILAIKQRQKSQFFLLTFIAMAFQLLGLFTLEFFIGLEILRLVLIYYLLKNYRETIKHYIPYLITLSVFFIWRIFIFESTREITNINWVFQTYYANPLWILKLPREFIESTFHTTVLAFFVPTAINFIRIPFKYFVLAFFLSLIVSVYINYLLNFLSHNINSKLKTQKELGKKFLLIGLVSIAGALIPIILLGRFVRMYLVYDRYTITSMLGVAFVIIGVSLYFIPRKLTNIFITFIIFLSLLSNLMTGFYRMDNWDKQQDLWWQFSWRVPDLQKNTMLILDFPKEDSLTFNKIITEVRWNRFYWLDYQVWTVGNMFFNTNLPPADHFRADFLEDKGVLTKIKNKVVENEEASKVTYTRNYQNVLILQTPSTDSCLWIMDSKIPEAPKNASELLTDSRNLSKTENILPDQTLKSDILGKEPIHSWCYYFQKASLARQYKNWNEILNLTNQVFEKNLRPKDPNEWLPFIDGLVILKNNQNRFKTTICNQVNGLKNGQVKIYCQT